MKKLFLLTFAICHLTSYMFSQGTWTQKANFGGTARVWSAGFSIGTKGYIGTGVDSLGYKQDFWEWNQATNAWTQKADFGGTPRRYATGFSIGTKGYIGLGIDTSGNSKKDFWEWDQATNVWTQKANFGGTARASAVGFSIGAKGYIGTGGDTMSLNDFWEWNQTTNIWTQKSSLGGATRVGATAFSIGTKGYIGTGNMGTSTFLKDFWEWDQTTNVWTQKADFGGSGRNDAVGFSIGTKGYIGTGCIGFNFGDIHSKDFWEWNQMTNIWTQKTSFGGTERDRSVGFSIGTKGYVGTGHDWYATSSLTKDFWEFDPNANGINETDLENLISVYPNPTSGTLEINNGKLKIENVTAYNSNGEKVYSNEKLSIVNYQLSIDLSSQPNGIYFIHLNTEKRTVTKKVLLQK